jgi:hypothetical protein
VGRYGGIKAIQIPLGRLAEQGEPGAFVVGVNGQAKFQPGLQRIPAFDRSGEITRTVGVALDRFLELLPVSVDSDLDAVSPGPDACWPCVIAH